MKRPGPRRRFFLADLMAEAATAMFQRPSRLVLTSIGVTVGVASLVATVGLASTAAAQIGGDFNALLATQVGVGGTSPAANLFPSNSENLVARLSGVRSSGVWYVVDANAMLARSQPALLAAGQQARLVAATPGYLGADQVTVIGRKLDPALDRLSAPVGDIGIGLAEAIGVTTTSLPAPVLVDGRLITIVGVLSASPIDPTLLSSTVVPYQSAMALWGGAGRSGESMVIWTNPGAAQVVATEAPLVLRPDFPRALTAVAPPDPVALRR